MHKKKTYLITLLLLLNNLAKYLDYDNKSYFSFDEISQQEISYHTDGVSCLDCKRIPKYLFFYVEKHPQRARGEFKISFIPNIIKKLPEGYLKVLKSQKLQYLNYNGTLKKFIKPKGTKGDVVSFEKYCFRKVNGESTLDMFLPIDKVNKDVGWEYKMKFESLSLIKSKKILNFIKDKSEEIDCEKLINFFNNDILILNNYMFFHGRKKFSKQIKRNLHRIQILNSF